MHLFYSSVIQEDSTFLSKEESHHCIKVMRFQAGKIIFLADGRGNLFKTSITEPDPKKCGIEIVEVYKEYQKRNYYIHIVIAPTKNIDRIEWFVEKAVELGVDEITFLLCDRSERRHIKLERLEKVAVSAMKQSLKAYLPKLNELVKFETFVKQPLQQSENYIAYLPEMPPPLLKNDIKSNTSYSILIGPEGDFSEREIGWALKNNYKAVSLGKSRLRTETAGIAACHLFNLKND